MLLINLFSGVAVAAANGMSSMSGMSGMSAMSGMSGNRATGQSCSLFKNSNIAKTIRTTLLKAAEKGHMFRVETSNSQIRFCVDSKIRDVEGSFGKIRGGIALDQQQVSEEQAVIVIDTGSLQTNNPVVKSMIKSEEFFDVKNHPEILFVSTGVEWIGPTKAVLRGDLTLRGVTKTVTFDVKLTSAEKKAYDDDEEIMVHATTSIKRSDFGMDSFTGMVSDSVKLCMSVRAKKYQA
ncbi:MAG: YceI family protein [Pseudomonadota bacterium]